MILGMHQFAADIVVLLHFAFILFVTLGGLLVFRWKSLAWLHVPAVLWGALIEFTGWICPLTPLENVLRRGGGGSAYSSSFIEYYLVPLIYPSGLTRTTQMLLGLCVIVINTTIYALLLVRSKAQHGSNNAD